MSARKLWTAIAMAMMVALLLPADAWGKRKKKGDDEEAISPFTTTEEANQTRVAVDINGDRIADIWNYYPPGADVDASAPTRREIDLNRDGRADVITFYEDDVMSRE
ncbi:MAG: hypothetical protein QGH45_03980, partial [Myxococcota bacterium]|nr:hypothetical protein [Myxococcota bacterium]